MKIRTDFVTNSSSTSFVIITSEDFKRSDFLRLMGIDSASPLSPIFDSLYNSLKKSMYSTKEIFHYPESSIEDWLSRFKNEFAEEVIHRMFEAKSIGKQVFVGKLSSDSDPIEGFFCVDSFELEDERIYFNALQCAW